MEDLGIRVLFDGQNGIRLLQGLWVTIEISLLSVIGSCFFGILTGLVMTLPYTICRVLSRIYLEIVRIMPQLVLLFIAYFGLTRSLGINLSGTAASVAVFIFWGAAEMGDLVRSALSPCRKASMKALKPWACHGISSTGM